MVKKQILRMEYSANYLPERWDALAREHDVEIVDSHAESQEEFMAFFRDPQYNIVAVANSWPGARKMGGYSPEMIRELSSNGSLQAICHQGAGYDVVGDIHLWQEYGTVQISNTPNAVASATANTAVWLILSAMRNFYRMTTNLRNGKWLGEGLVLGHEPKGRVLGIVGMGNIGCMIRDRARVLGFEKIRYFRRTRLPQEQEQDTEYMSSLDALLSSSDVVVLAVPLNRHTHHLINRETLAKCRPGVVIINIARGPVIDEQALVDALESGHVQSVGLDVYENEPEVHPGLLKHPDAMLLPHCATFTYETREECEIEHMDNVFAAVSKGLVLNLVPELRSVFPQYEALK